MNVYIMTDMEGVSGINRQEQCQSGSLEWRKSRLLVEGDFNAAVEGAVLGGAELIVLNDAHGGGQGNIRLENMSGKARYERPLRGRNMMPALLGEKFQVAFLIGAHAMAGTQDAFLDHTMSAEAWHNYRVNGERHGEIAMFAAYLGEFGVPLTLVTGDEAACHEARELLGKKIETVAVKQGIGRQRASCIVPAEAHDRIRQAAERATALAGKVNPFKFKYPAEVHIEFNRSDYADEAAARPGVERVDGRTVMRTVQSARELVGW